MQVLDGGSIKSDAAAKIPFSIQLAHRASPELGSVVDLVRILGRFPLLFSRISDCATTNTTLSTLGRARDEMVFGAAEFPFRKVAGVEFSEELHQSAERDLAKYRVR